MARGNNMRRQRFSNIQQNKIIKRIERLGAVTPKHPSAARFHRVALRLRYWLAGVDNSAQWAALYDSIEHNYARHRISEVEAVIRLREIGIGAEVGRWQFPKEVEQARMFSAAKRPRHFDTVQWELDHYRRQDEVIDDPDYRRDAKRNGDFDQWL